MKKNLVLLIIVITHFSLCKSQFTEKMETNGKYLIGGQFEFDNNNLVDDDESKIVRRNYSFGAQLGYFFFKNIVMGADINISKFEFDHHDISFLTHKTIELAPFIKYYSPYDFFVFGQIGVGQQEYIESDIFYKIGIGYPIYLAKNISLDISGNYMKRNYTISSYSFYTGNDDQTKYSAVGFLINMGFKIYL